MYRRCIGIMLLLVAVLASSAAATTELVSKDPYGGPGNGHSWWSSISGDGRYIAYTSKATNLLPGINYDWNVYLYDAATKETKLVTRSYLGSDVYGLSTDATVSGNGEYVVFYTSSTNLIPAEPGSMAGAYRYTIADGSLERISEDANGVGLYGYWEYPDISADGKLAVFADRNNAYIKNLENGQLDRLNKHYAYPQNRSGNAGYPKISGDGRYVVFAATGGSLIPGTTPPGNHLYVYNVASKENFLLMENVSSYPQSFISHDGRFVTFHTTTPNVDPNNPSDGSVQLAYFCDRDADQDGIYDEPGTVTFEQVGIGPLQADGYSIYDLSPNGRYALVSTWIGSHSNLYVYDRISKSFEILNFTYQGQTTTTHGGIGGLSSNGKYVSFSVGGSGMTPDDLGGYIDVFLTDRARDEDGDLFDNVDDCNDQDPAINPAATEIPYNGIDENCNGMNDEGDQDGDGFSIHLDCNDNDVAINPEAAEIIYNGIDENCNGLADDDDLDQDGYLLADDCNDSDPAINPGQSEIPYNGIDENCNGPADDDDLDQDGYLLADDCNDADAAINPGQTETPYNGIDENCNGATDDTDFDLDGFDYTADCNDSDVGVNPAAYEIFGNGIDENCNGPEDDTQADVIVDSLADEVQELPLDALLPPPDATNNTTSATEVANNRITSLQNQVNGVSDLLSTINASMIDADKLTVFSQALLDLNDILVKTDGFYGGNPNNDWVTTQKGQDALYPLISSTIAFVQGEIDKLVP